MEDLRERVLHIRGIDTPRVGEGQDEAKELSAVVEAQRYLFGGVLKADKTIRIP